MPRLPFARCAAAFAALAAFASLSLAAPKAPAPAAETANGEKDKLTGTEFKADKDMARVLEAWIALNPKPLSTLDPATARTQPTPADAALAVLKQKEKGKEVSPASLVPGVTSVDREIKGPARALPARIYTPDGAGPFPVVVYYHGGGWVLANKAVYVAGARGLAKQANAVLVSVDYRLAPEAKFPAQQVDAMATYEWVLQNAASIKGDPKRVAVAGESAGGSLALSTALTARDRKLQAPVHVLAIYPITQLYWFESPSYVDSATARPLDKAAMQWFASKVFIDPADKNDPRIDLVNANLKGLPPVTLINAQIDPLRSDGDLLAEALHKAGVTVDHKIYNGVTHEFFGMAAVVDKAKEAQAYAGKQLKKAFGEK